VSVADLLLIRGERPRQNFQRRFSKSSEMAPHFRIGRSTPPRASSLELGSLFVIEISSERGRLVTDSRRKTAAKGLERRSRPARETGTGGSTFNAGFPSPPRWPPTSESEDLPRLERARLLVTDSRRKTAAKGLERRSRPARETASKAAELKRAVNRQSLEEAGAKNRRVNFQRRFSKSSEMAPHFFQAV
jgi:hypothetical protein